MRQGITLLGATGSIGASSLDVIARHPDRFELVALTAHSRVDALADLCATHHPRIAVIGDPALEASLRGALAARGLSVEARAGASALAEVAADPRAHVVIAAIVGGLLLTSGQSQIRNTGLTPQRTVQQMQRDVATAKEQLR